MTWRTLGALAVVLGTLGGAPVSAQAPGARAWRPRLQLDNDAYNFWVQPAHRPDEQYTNGVRVSLESWTAPLWGKRFASRRPDCATTSGPDVACRLTTITLGQDIYTPHLDRTPFAVADWERERPYFGWLYLTGQAQLAGPRLLRTTSLSVGVTGPPSLGRSMQSLFHAINHRYTREASGWETQIGFEPGLVLSQRYDVRALRLGGPRGLALEVAPAGGISVGNILTEADAGGVVRLGMNLSHPWQPAAWIGRPRGEFFLRAGGRVRRVWYDMSLDGNTVGNDRHVPRVPGVGEYHFGGGVRWRRLRMEYRAITTTRAYEGGPGHHTWSTLSTGFDGIR